MMIPETTYNLITRQTKPQTSVVFQKLPDPCPPFGLPRSPAFQFMQRLRDYPPNLQDAIVVASTASIDIGIVTRSKTPLTNDVPAEKITSVFTTTAMADDSRRAQMPMSKDQTDTSPIGVCFDLSSKDKVLRPLPKEEFDASQGPLPALMVLNNEGVLSSWWIVYAESIRQGTTYPGLVAAGGLQAQQQPQAERQASPFASAGTQAAPSFGQSNFGKPSVPAAGFGSAFSKPASSAFNSTSSPTSGFGAPTNTSTTSQSGGSTFGQPSFGSATPMSSVMGGSARGAIPTGGAAFGTAGGFGNRGSVWGTPSSGTAAASGSVFGQSGFGGANQSPFGVPSTGNTFGSNTPTAAAAPTSGGFASFAGKTSGFMTAAPATSSAESPFGQNAQGASFGSGMDTDTGLGATPKKDAEAPKSIFGGGSSGFTLGTTFKGEAPSANEASKPEGNELKSMFGEGFGSTLGEAQKEATTPTKDADMDEEDVSAPGQNAQTAPVQKATINPAAPKFQFPSVAPSAGGFFGTQAQTKTTPAAVNSSQPSSSTFGKPTPITTTPKDTPQKPEQPIRPPVELSPKIKKEPQSDDETISPLNEDEAAPPLGYVTPKTSSPSEMKGPEDPVPPESTSKTSFAPGDSSNSSKSSEEAPLPPDFLPSKTKVKEVEPPPVEQFALPKDEDDSDEEDADADAEGDEDEDGLDDEGSGIDVAQEISPSTDPTQSPRVTPGSSFGGPLDKSPVGGLFSRVTRPHDGQAGRSLFGEIGNASTPHFPPPSKTQESPRSPSPVRSTLAGDSLRPDNSRSVSTPGPFNTLANRKNKLSQVAVPSKSQPSAEETRRQDRERTAAEHAKQALEEQDLSDREDEKVREELETEVEGTKELDAFLAHQDYVAAVDKPGIPGQIEKVYRDINSMIDTLGLNARSLTAFVKGHTELYKEPKHSREDLKDPKEDDWCLIEIGDLNTIEDELEKKLEGGQIQDVQKKLNECRELRKGVASLRAKGGDFIKAVEIRSDPDVAESAKTAPLRPEQATQQHELRKQLMKFQKLLAETEENVTMLRAKLASCETSNVNGRPLKKPTVEAVTNTIKKMTSMVEKKSGDIDVLETQLRHVRLSSAALSQSSREGSPFTPLPSTSPMPKLFPKSGGTTLQNGQSYTPSRSIKGSGTPRKAIQEVTPEEVQRFREKAQRRQQVNRIMKEAFSTTGPRIRALD